ncbi:MAG: deoxyribodipyrimidine photolyase [Acidobacteria bacterium]|nr:deoxyribodipyrimidine photolyase [Acidobacteriota bacterium]
MQIPPRRLIQANAAPVRPERAYVLYWMTAARRTRSNFALQHAATQADELGLPLVVLEAVRAGYPWANARHHRFILDGMAANADAFASTPVGYYPFAERSVGDGHGLLQALGARAALVVGDDSPMFFLRRMVESAAAQLDCRLDLVDGNGIVPLRVPDRTFKTAYSFRRFLHKVLHDHLDVAPGDEPLAGADLAPATVPEAVLERWPALSAAELADPDALVARLPIDQSVAPTEPRGGAVEARRHLDRFVQHVDGYADDRNRMDGTATSGLSPYLHYGHISSHTILAALARSEGIEQFEPQATGKGQREGWWNASPSAEAFLDQLITWRELGFNRAHREGASDTFDTLPEWAQHTLMEHAADPRPYEYEIDTLEAAGTHDELWNAAQRQLARDGIIHNYLRMLWGKKILEWASSPELALSYMLELNNKYALDGRDPNSVSGICWVMGRYDRAWGPERPIFGKIRYMSSANAARKLRLADYLARYGPQPQLDLSATLD